MNPDKPSRDEIEAKLTALLLGELPEEEARLLRWTIAQDEELMALHDRLKLTIGLVREVSAHPSETAPLKLSDERRKKLLAHFKTPRPRESFWLKPLKLSPLITALAMLAVMAVLAALLLPALSTAKRKAQSFSAVNEAKMHELQARIEAEDATTASQAEKPRVVAVGAASSIAPPPASLPPLRTEIVLPQTEMDTDTLALNKTPEASGGTTFSAGALSQNGTFYANAPAPNSMPQIPRQSSVEPATGLPAGGTIAGDNYAVQQANVRLAFANRQQMMSDNVTTSDRTVGFAGVGGGGGGFGGVAGETPASAKLAWRSLTENPPAGVSAAAASPLGAFPGSQSNEIANNDREQPATVGPVGGVAGNIFADQTRKTDSDKVSLLGDIPAQGSLFASHTPSAQIPVSTPAPSFTQDTAIPTSLAYTSDNLTISEEAQPPPEGISGTMAATKKTDGEIAYQDATRKLAQLENAHKLLSLKIKAEDIDTTIPRTSRVQIVDAAQPGKSQGLWQKLTGQVQSTARVKMENEGGIVSGMEVAAASNEGYDPYFIQTSFEVIQSQLVLGKVVDALKLDQTWAAKNGGEKLTKEEAVARLKDRLTLRPVKNTKLIEISVTSDQPDESAKIANAVAEAYREYRLENSQQTVVAGRAALKLQYAYEDQKIGQLQAEVDRLSGSQVETLDVNAAISRYAELTGRTLLRSSLPAPAQVSVHMPASGSKEDQALALQQALASDNLSLVNIGDHFVKAIPSAQASSTATAINSEDAPLRKPAPDAPIPQPEVLTTDNAFSTFALNISDVSFQLAAASLEKGVLPAAASIRSEEFINAFDYRDPEAAPGEPIAFTSERARDPFAQNRDLLRFSIKTSAAGRQPGRPLNLVLLLDNSGSMERADRVAIIREALRVLATQLQAQDTISVVTFARTARLWLDGAPGNEAGADLEKVGGLTPQGGTNLEEAMRLAYETARRHYLANGMNRVVLLTDGAANLGNVDARVLTQRVETNRRQGIALDCFGIGWEDYNDDLLEQLSSNGDGRYAFLNSPADASAEFAAKLAGALQIAAEEVKVQVEFNPDRVTAYRQIGYAKHQLTKQQFRDNTVAAGEIAAAEAGNALYTVELKPDGNGPVATVRLRYRVPSTTDYRERSWNVPYSGNAPALEKSGPAMRLAATAGAFSEWLATNPFAQEVTLDQLLNDLRGVPEIYGADPRPKKLEWMIRQAKSLEGKAGQY